MKNDPEEYIFGGIPTFMRAPYVSPTDLADFEVAVLGIPVDHGSSYRDGAKMAPRAIREHSHWDRLEEMAFVDLDSGQALTCSTLKIADVGDVLIHPGDADQTNGAIRLAVSAIRKSCFPLLIGGDHTITYGAFRGLLDSVPQHLKPVGILHFDAHPDVESSYVTLPRVWHGNPFRLLIEEGMVLGRHIATIGPRGILPRTWFEYVQHQGIRLFTAADVHKHGLATTVEVAVEQLMRHCQSLYISFDIDFIDPADAPGTGTPSFGGIRAFEAINVFRKMPRVPYVGMDLVEVNPSFDVSGRTSILACDLLWNFLAFSYQK